MATLRHQNPTHIDNPPYLTPYTTQKQLYLMHHHLCCFYSVLNPACFAPHFKPLSSPDQKSREGEEAFYFFSSKRRWRDELKQDCNNIILQFSWDDVPYRPDVQASVRSGSGTSQRSYRFWSLDSLVCVCSRDMMSKIENSVCRC
jgi:hypothetical protein